MNYFKSILRTMLLLALLLSGLAVFFAATNPGLLTLVKLANVILPGTLRVQHLEGDLMHQLSFEAMDYSDSHQHMTLKQGRLAWQFIQLWQPKILILKLQIESVRMTQKAPKQTNQPLTLPKIPIDIELKALHVNHIHIASFKASKLKASARFNHDQWDIRQLTVIYANVKLSILAQGLLQKPYPVSATFSITPLDPTQTMTRGTFQFEGLQSIYRWHGQLTGMIPMKIKGTLQNLQQLNTEMTWGENNLRLYGSVPNQLHIDAFIPKPNQLHSSLIGLQTVIKAKAIMQNMQHATLTLTASSGRYQLPQGSSIPFEGGHVALNLTPEKLNAQGAFTFDRDKVIDVSMTLPNFALNHATAPQQVLDGKLTLHINSLDFLQGLTNLIDHPHGQIIADLTASGTLGTPDIQGSLALNNASVSLPSMGLTLNPIQANLTTHHKQWEMQSALRAQDGATLELKGQGQLAPQLMGTITLQGNQFPAIKTPEYTVFLSPDLTFNFQPSTYAISGSILVPKAQLKPMSFSNTHTLTSDAVFIDEKTETPAFNTILSTSIQIKMGDDVALDVQGLHGFLDGAIQVTQLPHNPMNAIGELTIRSGKYQAYGQDLSVEQGQLLFSGGTLTNPDISLRAVRTFNNNSSSFSGSNQLFDFNASNLQTIDFGNHLTVGVAVSGHLNAPKITLFSVPASLSQADILSMLLLGKPASQASRSGGALLLTAISAMNLDTGTKGMQLLSQLKQSLGFDFNVQSSSQFNQKTNQTSDNTSFVVGKSLSKRLYLSYNIGLLQKDSNMFTLKYLLNKFFSIQVTASDTGNGLDLLYSAQP